MTTEVVVWRRGLRMQPAHPEPCRRIARSHFLQYHRPAMSTKRSIEEVKLSAAARPGLIRALDGLHRNATFAIESGLTIGRGSDCDIQIGHDGISRRHARLARGRGGTCILTDLQSTNGTFVGSRRIVEVELEAGMAFEIMRHRFRYEEVSIPGSDAPDPDAPISGISGSQRTTVTYLAFQAVDPDRPAHRPSSRSSTGDPGTNHAAYSGDLVGDIATYRTIRARLLRGSSCSQRLTQGIRQLEGALGCSSNSKQSTLLDGNRRLPCRFLAQLRTSDGADYPVEVTEIGVGGARVRAKCSDISVGTLVWLVIERLAGKSRRTFIFASRIVRSCSNDLDLGFSGAPGWSSRDRRSVDDETQRDPRPHQPPKGASVARLRVEKRRILVPSQPPR